MGNKKFWIGILVMVMVFGMSVVGCDNDPGNGNGADPTLNGIWTKGGSVEFTYNNGNWEDRLDGNPYAKGTYTTNNGEITTKITHLWGDGGLYQLNLDAKWYTKAELKSLSSPIFNSVEEKYWEGHTMTYSINGNSITFTDENGTDTWTRK